MVNPLGQSEKMANLFDKLSDSYDDVGVDFFKPIASSLLEAMPPREGERWLDIGCGRGAVTIPAAQMIGPRGLALGIDISPGMVEHARRLGMQANLKNVEWKVDDAQSPATVKGRFDTISSSLVLFFLADPLQALKTWIPLLKPEGRIGVTTFGSHDPRWLHVDKVFQAYLPAHMQDARTSGTKGPFASDAGMEELLFKAGFQGARTESTSVPVHFADSQHWYDFTWSVGQRMMWLAVPQEKRLEVRREAEERLASYAQSDGSITFNQEIRMTFGTGPQD